MTGVATSAQEATDTADQVTSKSRASLGVSVFTKDAGPLTKRISLSDEGDLVSDGAACRMSHGMVRVERMSNMDDVAKLIEGLNPNEAIALGVVSEGALDSEGKARIVRHAEVPAEPQPGTIARTLNYIAFQQGRPGLMLLDYDTKGLPGDVQARVRVEGFETVLSEVMPEITDTSRLWRPSTSSGIRHETTGEKFEKEGGHQYLAVADAADIPRATRVLHQRCWLAGLGFILVGRAGQLLERSIIDVAVGSPERLVFEGAPEVVPPLVQDARPCTVSKGKLLDTRSAIPDLSASESAEFERLLAAAKAEADVRAAPIRKSVDDAEVRKLRDTGLPEPDARARVQARRQGRLFPHIELHFDNLGSVTVADVLLSPAAYNEETLADPLEPDTGRCRAKLYVNSSGTVVVHTFARGGANFHLVADRAVIDRAIADNDADAVLGEVKRLMARAALSPTDLDKVVAATALRSGAGKRPVRQELDLAQKSAAGMRAQASRSYEAQPDGGRATLEAPHTAGEFGPTMTAVDDILCSVDDAEPPFRLVDGQFGLIRERVPSGLHLLLTEAEEATQDVDASSFIPAPAQASLLAADYTDVALEIEKHVCFMRRPKEGDPYPVRIPEPHGKAYLKWQSSKLPVVAALVTLPLVLPGRRLFTGSGLDREFQVVFRIPPELHNCMPDPAEVDLDYAVDRLDWLFNEWLVDVETDAVGKATIVAMTAQTIQRHLLAERPAYVIDAGQRGGGKTTTVIMSHVAVTGVRPPAAAWAEDPNERRKGLLAALMTGVAMIPFDNIPRGTLIRCPHIEAALTSAEKTDRVLQESRVATVSTASTLVFTGNNISPAGDMASRTLRISLEVNRPDPENRVFQHPDPIGWTVDHRGEILNAIYSIMLVPGLRPASNTRFKTWHRLIGAPIELTVNEWLRRERAAGRDVGRLGDVFSFQDSLKENEEDDVEAEGSRELYSALWTRFPSEVDDPGATRAFKGGEFAAMLEYPAKPDGLAADWVEYTAERHRVDAIRGALAGALGGTSVNGKITAIDAGFKLRALVGRAVSDGEAVMTLRRYHPSQGTKKKDSASYYLERRTLA